MKSLITLVFVILISLLSATPSFANGAVTAVATQSSSNTNISPDTIDCDSVDITKYSSIQVDKIRDICVTPQKQVTEQITPEVVRNWASLGKEFSVAITDTAKGLGIAANDFLMTPLGFLIAFYFMWDVMGGPIIGIPLLIFVIWLFMNFRYDFTHMVEYENKPTLFGLMNKQYIKRVEPRCEDSSSGMVFTFRAIGTFFMCWLIIGILIF